MMWAVLTSRIGDWRTIAHLTEYFTSEDAARQRALAVNCKAYSPMYARVVRVEEM